MVLTVRCTVDDDDSANRFCVRTIQTVDVRWPLSESRERYFRTVPDITCCMSVDLSFDESNLLFEIQH
jgi:hypothetical protein